MKVELLVCDKPTKDTGRVYPKELVVKALEKFKDKEGKYLILGTISPTEINESNYRDVSVDAVTHLIENVEWKNNYLYGDMTFINPTVENSLKDVEITALALRGAGDIQYLDGQLVVTELEIVSFDLPDFHALQREY